MFFKTGFLANIQYVFLVSPTWATSSTRLNYFNHSHNTKWTWETLSSLWCTSLHPVVALSLFQILSFVSLLRSSLSVKDYISQQHWDFFSFPRHVRKALKDLNLNSLFLSQEGQHKDDESHTYVVKSGER